MKKAILIIFLLILPNVVWAQKAPDGFCGLKWGSTKGDLEKLLDENVILELDGRLIRKKEDLNFGGKGGVVHFMARGNWELIGEVVINDYNFEFSRSDEFYGKFYTAWVRFPKVTSERPNNFDILYKALTMKYGKPNSITPLVLKLNPSAKVGMAFTWTLENKVEITLKYNDMEETGVNGTLSYIYLPIWRGINEVREKDAVKTKDKL